MSTLSRNGVAALVFVLVLGTAHAVLAQAIPPHPRQLAFEALDFEPPAAARHRHTLSNGVVVFVVDACARVHKPHVHHSRSAGHENGRQIKPSRRHQHAGIYLVAPAH